MRTPKSVKLPKRYTLWQLQRLWNAWLKEQSGFWGSQNGQSFVVWLKESSESEEHDTTA